MIPRHILAIALAALFASGSALAQSPATIKANIERLTGGKVKVDQIQATPAPGIYQVISDGEVFYTDASGRFGIIGGTMLTGGVGNIIGTFFGVLSLSTIKNIVSSLGLDEAWWTNITVAGMICLFLVIQSLVLSRKNKDS